MTALLTLIACEAPTPAPRMSAGEALWSLHKDQVTPWDGLDDATRRGLDLHAESILIQAGKIRLAMRGGKP